MNGRRACVIGGRSGRQPDPRRRAAGLAPPPSLLHDSPGSSGKGREQSDPPPPHHHPSPHSESFSRETRGSPPHPKPFSPPLPPNPPTLGRAGGTCARLARLPFGEVGACPRVPRLPSRPSRPPATRAHRLSAHRSSDHPRAPRARALSGREGGREKQPGLPPPSHSRPARRPPSPRLPAAARSQPRALLSRRRSPHTYRRVRTTSIRGGPPRGSAGGATPPLPHPAPQPSAPAGTCALHAAAASLRGAPSCPRGGRAHEEGEGAARDGVRAGNAVPRSPAVGRETERGARWGWGPKATLTGSTVAILDRSDRTTAPEGGGERKKMRFKPGWLINIHVTDVSVWRWRRLRKTAAAWGTRGFWEV